MSFPFRPVPVAALNLVKKRETLRLTSYPDERGIWTIGWGHTDSTIGPNQTWSEDKSNLVLSLDLYAAATGVATSMPPETTNNQYSASISLAYNIGVGAFHSSSVVRLSNVGDFAGAADAFLLWDKEHIDGNLVESEGLLARREEERTLFLTED